MGKVVNLAEDFGELAAAIVVKLTPTAGLQAGIASGRHDV
jgi:hypothetical protein